PGPPGQPAPRSALALGRAGPGRAGRGSRASGVNTRSAPAVPHLSRGPGDAASGAPAAPARFRSRWCSWGILWGPRGRRPRRGGATADQFVGQVVRAVAQPADLFLNPRRVHVRVAVGEVVEPGFLARDGVAFL